MNTELENVVRQNSSFRVHRSSFRVHPVVLWPGLRRESVWQKTAETPPDSVEQRRNDQNEFLYLIYC